jgi:hypothetical protein
MAFLGEHGHQFGNWLREVAFARTLARGAVSGKIAFCFLLPDERLLGRVWVLIRIAAALRRLVATTL